MLIFIRHGEKLYYNGRSETLKHDSPLTENGKEEATRFGKELIEKYGNPSYVFSSPYLRCRETAIAMMAASENGNSSFELYIDRRVSEYLGHHREEPLDVTEETLRYDPPHPEHFKELAARVEDAFHAYEKLESSDGPIWVITHGIVLSLINNGLGRPPKRGRSFGFLGTVIVQDRRQ